MEFVLVIVGLGDKRFIWVKALWACGQDYITLFFSNGSSVFTVYFCYLHTLEQITKFFGWWICILRGVWGKKLADIESSNSLFGQLYFKQDLLIHIFWTSNHESYKLKNFSD